MNLIEKRIQRLAFELFSTWGLRADLVEFKIKELEMCYSLGYNTRAEILGLLKIATGEKK